VESNAQNHGRGRSSPRPVAVAETSDGAIHFLTHDVPEDGTGAYPLRFTSSRDLGQTWSPPSSTLRARQASWATAATRSDCRRR
jgi:hypothetical protein